MVVEEEEEQKGWKGEVDGEEMNNSKDIKHIINRHHRHLLLVLILVRMDGELLLPLLLLLLFPQEAGAKAVGQVVG